MEKTIYVLLLLTAVAVMSNGVYGKAKARETLSEINRKLKLLNKPAVKSIKSEDGDIIDCVDIYKQPAFDHPALRNHTLQLTPSFRIPSEKLGRRNESPWPVVTQTWQKSGSCPKGTVPIRRIKRQDLLRVGSLEDFGRKAPEIAYASNETDAKNGQFVKLDDPKLQIPTIVNRSAATLATTGYSYIGAKGDINIWNPNVDLPDDFTTAQIWLKAGPGDNFESVESGWVVNPKLYGDKLTRLFAYWTTDSYKSTGCFDLTCTGFVQTGTQYALGATISPWGPQYDLTFGIFKDPNTGNWWLKVADNVVIGYWPGALFSSMRESAILVEWGGQVYSSNVKKTPHTKTAMGSGSFSQTLFNSSCYINHVRIMDYSTELKYPEWVGTWADEDYCYNALNYREGIVGEPIFFFGGPGQNPNCM